jgi:hypothetical protein
VPSGSGIERAWNACRGWVGARDGLTSELFVLEIPERSIDDLLCAVRARVGIVAVMASGGLESFSDPVWTPDDDDDLVMSTFFIGLCGGTRLQHFLAPARPRSPGPWVAVSRGPLDLEVAFWPDEVFDPARPDEHGRAFERIARYGLELREATGAAAVCLTHGCDGDPRPWLAGGRAGALALYP